MTVSGEERREIEEINGERVRVVYKTDGQKVDIVSAEKENPQAQQENKGETQSSDQEKEERPPQQNVEPTKTDIELTPAEKEKLQKKLEVKVEQETKEARAKVFKEGISPNLLDGASACEKPTLVFLAGQSGAGKGGLRDAQMERFAQQGGAVVIDPDKLREFNKDYVGNIQADSRTAADKAPVGDWTQSAFLEGIQGKRNIILDGTAANTERVLERADIATKAGYQVEILGIAVPAEDSWISVVERHEKGKVAASLDPKHITDARFVPKSPHDESVLGVTNTIATCEYSKGCVDRIALFPRGNYDTPFYENTNARQGGSMAGAEALEKVRGQARTPEELAARESNIAQIKEKLMLREGRDASPAELRELSALAFEGKDKGFSETARDITPDRRPDISAQEYIKNPEARKEVRAQAEERIKAYAAELRQKGVSAERVSKVEHNLQRKLDNPAAAYGIKEGFDLRDKKRQADTLTSRKDQEEYCDKKERFLTDIRTVKKAFGADIKERTPQQQAADKSRASWDRHGRLTMVTVKKQMAERNVPAAEQEKKLESMKRDLQKAKLQSMKRHYKQTAEQTTKQSQGGGGGGGHVQRQSMRHCKYPIFPRNDFIL